MPVPAKVTIISDANWTFYTKQSLKRGKSFVGWFPAEKRSLHSSSFSGLAILLPG